MEMEHDMGGARGGLRGFDGAVEEEERGLLECSVCAAFFNTKITHSFYQGFVEPFLTQKSYINFIKGF